MQIPEINEDNEMPSFPEDFGDTTKADLASKSSVNESQAGSIGDAFMDDQAMKEVRKGCDWLHYDYLQCGIVLTKPLCT